MKLKTNFILTLFLAFVVQVTFAQDKKISGTVSDKTGVLPGVSVILKSTNKGTESDFDGKYSIFAKTGDVLVFRYLGMKTLEIKVGSGSIVNAVLEEDSQSLDEVVITGITTTDKRLFTGSATSIKASEVKLDGVPEIGRALEGRAAGVTVQNVSGTFGAAPKIRIRGATSIYGSSKPLWVVDGVIMEDVIELTSDDLSSGDATTLISSAISGLNPDDIQSFEVLKDGSATSIYGARAMAGVIVITTKKGKAGVSSFNYTNETTFRMRPSYNNFNIMNSQDQMSVYEEMRSAGWLNYSDIGNASESGVYGEMYKGYNEYNSSGAPLVENTPEGRAAFLKKAELRNTNWFKELFNINAMQSHSISMSSGTDRANYYGSVSALVDPGWTKSSSVNRYTANFKSIFKITDKLTLTAISNASFRKQRAPGTLSQDTDVVTGEVKRDFDINPYSFALNSSRALDPDKFYTRNYADFNIVKELEENYIDINNTDLRFQGQLNYKINPQMEISVLGAVKSQNTSIEHNTTEFSNQANAYRAMGNEVVRDSNPFLYSNPDDEFAVPVSVLSEGGIYRRTDYDLFGYDFRAMYSYKNIFNEDHTVNFYGGAELNAVDRKNTNFTGWGLQYSLGEIPFYDYNLFKQGIEENNLYYGMENTRKRNLAFYGNALYSWKRRYTILGTLRYEGSNKLGKSTSARWLPTWNVSGAWNAHEEEFFENLRPIINSFTLKASYSLTADSGPYYVTNSIAEIKSENPWRPSAGSKESSLYISSLANGELTYEKKHEINIGAEASFLKGDRLSVAVDWYKRDNFDLIGRVNTQGIGGELTKYGNVASMTSDGLELSISAVPFKNDDFSWQTSFIYSKITNKVTELETRQRVIDLVTGNGFAREGYPVRSIFSIPFEGLNAEGLPTFKDQDGNVTVGDIYFQERDKLDFLKYSGSADPTDVGSFGNIFKYKNLSLNVFTTFSFGNVVRLNPVFSSEYSDLASLPKEYQDRWVVPGDENTTNVPVIATQRQEYNYGNTVLATAYNAYNYSDARIAKGDFIRLKQVSLAYNFPKDVVESLNVNSLSLKLQATNLFLLYSDDKLNGQDPEFFNSGGVASPLAKQITFTLRLGL
ncbi:SusC/RagA family TonB-linked outer membrane protein [Polaribacter sp. Z014]|uniref:SusC/RagA family TonB-linked outer membrane protein n=1 Tax=Polaribacter sp. Z014 TaxID=2927126 RepID=UPI00201FF18F|nr:SusC/RagA family TonB-linked outer membrane protein [Polaribacter sp. Z014]MCL7761821.1 SusC/RagA family TonB-linked outer membrane protein [Polaribacter sp. Z014]